MGAGKVIETVVLNGRLFPRYLTSPLAGGWRVRDMRDACYIGGVFPNKRMALAATKRLNRGMS